jgi:histone H3/H4
LFLFFSTLCFQFLPTEVLQRIAKEVDPSLLIEREIAELLVGEAESFVQSVVRAACDVAIHRHSDKVEICDLQTVLELQHDIRIPWPDSTPASSSSSTSSASTSLLFRTPPFSLSAPDIPFHEKRLAAVGKSQAVHQFQQRTGDVADSQPPSTRTRRRQ